jgi:endonuclease/exonuclease/phosphatase family metal-dependent hydrolase
VLVVNAHPFATNPAAPAVMAGTVRERYRQAQTLVAFAQTHPGPLLYPCDCNTADQNDAYRLIATAWHDSWREVGLGWGQTFPGTDSSGHSTRLVLHGITVPRWLVRIDYVWHSSHWRAVEARIGPWDGHSDHRPTIARLVLVGR